MGWLEGDGKDSGQVKTVETVKTEPKKEDVSSLLIPLNKAAAKRGLKVGIYGGPGSGKTHFALTFPAPIIVLDTEIGSPALAKTFPEKDIKVVDVFQKGANGERDEVECFEKIKKVVDWVTDNVKEGTVVIDSGSDLWKFVQTYGKVKIFNLSPEARLKYRFDWGKINNLYDQILSTLIHSELNLVITGKVTNKYDAAGQETGETQSRWQKDTEYQLDVTVEMIRQRLKDKNVFYGIVDKSRINGELMGQKIDDISYDVLKEKLGI